jgi:hypothetical protein
MSVTVEQHSEKIYPDCTKKGSRAHSGHWIHWFHGGCTPCKLAQVPLPCLNRYILPPGPERALFLEAARPVRVRPRHRDNHPGMEQSPTPQSGGGFCTKETSALLCQWTTPRGTALPFGCLYGVIASYSLVPSLRRASSANSKSLLLPTSVPNPPGVI